MYCMPTRVRHHANHWEYRNEKVKVSVNMVLMLMGDSRTHMIMVECYERYKIGIMGKAWRSILKWPGEAWEMLPKKVRLALLTKDSVIIWLPLTKDNSRWREQAMFTRRKIRVRTWHISWNANKGARARWS